MQDTTQVFQIWHNLCSEMTSILAIQKQPTNRLQLNKSDKELYILIIEYSNVVTLAKW
jgi:hypothetical protein